MNIRLGFQVSQLDVGYSRKLVEGLNSFCSQHGVDLTVFPGRAAGWPHGGFEYQHSAIYKHISSQNLDCLVVASGTQCNYISTESFHFNIHSLSPLPVVSLAIPVPGVPTVKVDNRQGMYELLNHLTDVHDCSRIAIIAGPEGNLESTERFQIYRSFLEEKGLEFDPSLVIKGDFTPEGVGNALNSLLDEKGLCFDALFGLNDAMAIAALHHLQSRGFEVPDDVIVVGFDGIEQGRLEFPTLTTVYQPLREQAWEAARIAVDLANGKETPPELVLSTYPIIRESCGCMISSVASMDPDKEAPVVDSPAIAQFRLLADSLVNSKTLNYNALIRKFDTEYNAEYKVNEGVGHLHEELSAIYREYHSRKSEAEAGRRVDYGFQGARILLAERALSTSEGKLQDIMEHIILLRRHLAQLASMVAIEELVEVLQGHLEALDIKSCAVVIFDESIYNPWKNQFTLPSKAELILSYDQDWERVDKPKLFNPRKGMLPPNCFSTRTRTLLCSALYHREEQLGYIVYEPGKMDAAIYETIVAQLASTIKTTLIFSAKLEAEERLRTAMRELENHNLSLNQISMSDSLTGLYNRRGFLSLGDHSLDLAMRMEKTGMVVFCDLDGLKVINDTFGHDAGDRAIVAAAKILQKSFRSLDVVARLGGDEFTALAIDMTPDFMESLRLRVDKQVDIYNHESGEPFLLSLSMGAALFSGDAHISLKSLLSQADSILYAEKQAKGDRSRRVLRSTDK